MDPLHVGIIALTLTILLYVSLCVFQPKLQT
jgi:hypothetical protein